MDTSETKILPGLKFVSDGPVKVREVRIGNHALRYTFPSRNDFNRTTEVAQGIALKIVNARRADASVGE